MQGYLGGKAGAGNYFVLNEGADNELVVTEACYDVLVDAGHVIFAQSGAGGGWGEPFAREPLHVLEDVKNELVSVTAARESYGVVVDVRTMTVDEAETARIRKAESQRPLAPGAAL